jgi:eukaryotic-like serine/threonine-protein kinase
VTGAGSLVTSRAGAGSISRSTNPFAPLHSRPDSRLANNAEVLLTADLDRVARALADRYRIERELGRGGMATVYLAHDLKHDRPVAVKVLHPDLGVALGGDRFLSEIRTTARLQHPHILPLLDSGEAAGLLYYVMPFVTGETLRTRLERERQLPIDHALRIAGEVADALAHAHGLGVIHRDIKPENILLQGGHALVADFGIALAVQQAGGQRMTQTGLSLGTPQYMSPEQAMGERTIDARSDIYALGAVTYEMLVGEPPFTGPTVQAIVAKVLSERPTPPHTVRDTVPPAVEVAVLTALAKLPADRFTTAAEFAAALTDRATTTALSAAQRSPRGVTGGARWRDPLVLGLGTAVAVLAGAVVMLARPTGLASDPFPVRAVITAGVEGPIGPAALSPDGQSIVYSGQSPSGGGRVLYLRRLDQLTSREIVGTAAPAGAPVFSPDGKWVAYIAGRRRLVKVPLDGGPPVQLAEVADFGGVDWSTSGEIVVGAGIDEGLQGLYRVKATGGPLVPLTRVDTARKELSHQSPRVLPDGKTVLFTIWFGSVKQSEIAAASLDDGKVVPLGISGATPLGVVDDHLVYLNAEGAAMAMPFDLRGLRGVGTPTSVQTEIRVQSGGGSDHNEAFLSHAGGLVYLRGNDNRRLVWVDRRGAPTPVPAAAREFVHVRLSPSGRQVAVVIVTGAKRDLWTLDLEAGTLTPLTTTGATRNATWSADGRRILYASTHSGRAALWWHPIDGSGPAELAAVPRHNPWMVDLSPDGRIVVFNAIYDGTFNLETLSLDSTHQATDLSSSPTATEANGRFSPDGRWVAYHSDESGRNEVYLRASTATGGRVQVSANGGRRPVWGRDGRRIFYWEGSRMVAAALALDPAPRVVSREPLFEGRFDDDFDVSPDGSRFLMIESETSGLSLVVVPQWRSELRRLTNAVTR